MAEALFPGGKLDAQLGQTYRLKPDPLLAAFSGNSGTSSDLVGSFSVTLPAPGCDRPHRHGPWQWHHPAA